MQVPSATRPRRGRPLHTRGDARLRKARPWRGPLGHRPTGSDAEKVSAPQAAERSTLRLNATLLSHLDDIVLHLVPYIASWLLEAMLVRLSEVILSGDIRHITNNRSNRLAMLRP